MNGSHGIAQPVRRREDVRLLTGQGRFADDVSLRGPALCGVRQITCCPWHRSGTSTLRPRPPQLALSMFLREMILLPRVSAISWPAGPSTSRLKSSQHDRCTHRAPGWRRARYAMSERPSSCAGRRDPRLRRGVPQIWSLWRSTNYLRRSRSPTQLRRARPRFGKTRRVTYRAGLAPR